MPKARRNWDEAAGTVWPMLVQAARERRTLTYGEVSQAIQTNPLNARMALSPIQDYCFEHDHPPLTIVAVNKATGLPGSGFIERERGLEDVYQYPWQSIENPFGGFGPGVTQETVAQRLVNDPGSYEAVYRLVKNRGMRQRIFRQALLLAYDHQCCFCGLSFENALEASHIAPWSDCTGPEQIDPCNGLLLCATHHKLFDGYDLTLSADRVMMYRDPQAEDVPYSEADRQASLDLHGSTIILPEEEKLWPGADYIERRRTSRRNPYPGE